MPSPPAPHDVRLRKGLSEPSDEPRFPAGFSWRRFTTDDASMLHALLIEVFDDGSDGPFETWWTRLVNDPEYDPDLVFLVFDRHGALAAAAICWNTDFIKDLAVRQSARRQGLGEALLSLVFAVFAARGAQHIDLKTNLIGNADAMRLYRRLGMVEVDWAG